MPDSCRGPEPASLYPRILGADWLGLDESVRRAHLDDRATLCRSGTLRVRNGTSNFARMLIRLFGMPANKDAVVTNLEVFAVNQKEVWVRSFSGKIVKTTQYGTSQGVLCERMGAIELRFRLKVLDGGLRYEQIGAAVRLGAVAVRLPKFLRPCIEADERGAGLNQTHTSVVVRIPWGGLLVSYEGILDEVKTK